jgi:hypothetical protein
MRTSELKGAALNWAVAIAEGWKPDRVSENQGEYWWFFKESRGMNPKHYHPATHWGIGGPIIEREKIGIGYDEEVGWVGVDMDAKYQQGATPLEAAMRCYVVSKLGDEVQLPEELA